MSQASLSSFNEDLLRSISASLAEPSWLTDVRLEAFRQFISLPSEKNPLYTKYSRTFDIALDRFKLARDRTEVDFRSFFTGYLTGTESDILLQGNETQVHAELSRDLASKGVNLMSFHDALRQEEGAVRKLVEGRLVKSETDKYAAFVNAFFNCGTFVRVPRGVVLEKPLRKMLLLDSPRTSVIEQTFVIAEEEARLVYLEEQYSKGTPSPAFVASTAEVIARPNSHVDFSSIQLLDDQTTHLSNRGIEVSNDARATMSSLSLGASVSRSRTNFYLNGRGSFAEGFEIFFTDGKQRYDYETNLVHNSPDSTGSTQARGVLKGESQSIFKGMIKIVNAAKNSRSYLAHHAMILERTARSDGVPSLEIDNNEVKATHSASVAQIDEEQLFYLMARGLSPDEAKKMVVLGFFEPVLSRIPIEQTREGARFMIEGKWHEEKRRLVDRETLLAATGELTPEVKESEDIFERHYKYR
ncbi:MAG: Fe-S cluster assembly protein SufD [Nitrososphaerota archaeon]|jgi:Fe-S cluster assembly protein SufB/Fe-S cluster assembly protein SufD|nr:Fe-S cluster assembly protein SufD [Nitrososphaerota archaeon]MCL5672213.1 Fe-S cluster assembly protein SufD [Nitrososphaerota archaeon]MDG6903535.1 Fe-S cluster assembly protein SufD [Nitrososphaerota archaeon]MDG6912102.1 Fe-S cluster assembly protein SufD [Nitrososphaerota archaeon]MDG6924722.1 Fe-S cluster assembly protein SufD [Nitrososphaerota archaeon]